MKLHPFPRFPCGAAPTGKRGFTLPELLVAMSVFMLVIGGVVFAHIYGLSMFRITEIKLNATADARKTLGRITDEIRTSTSTSVGNVKNGVFDPLMDGETQQGTALLINPTTNSANYILYFINPSDTTFRRTTSTPGTAVILADSITNAVLFRAQDYTGQVLTNSQGDRVIHIDLEFYQPERARQPAEYYKLETAVTRHASVAP